MPSCPVKIIGFYKVEFQSFFKDPIVFSILIFKPEIVLKQSNTLKAPHRDCSVQSKIFVYHPHTDSIEILFHLFIHLTVSFVRNILPGISACSIKT